jgi:hypothetical protein
VPNEAGFILRASQTLHAASSAQGPTLTQIDDVAASDGEGLEENNQTYKYTKLEPDELRILVVHPGTSTTGLDCSLDIHRMPPVDAKGRAKPILEGEQEAQRKPYEALSYSWGGQTPKHRMNIRRRDHPGFHVLKVTDHLKEALLALRSNSEARRFWVDAVCIQQDNLEEKSYQLPLMARIYSEAKNVCVARS